MHRVDVWFHQSHVRSIKSSPKNCCYLLCFESVCVNVDQTKNWKHYNKSCVTERETLPQEQNQLWQDAQNEANNVEHGLLLCRNDLMDEKVEGHRQECMEEDEGEDDGAQQHWSLLERCGHHGWIDRLQHALLFCFCDLLFRLPPEKVRVLFLILLLAHNSPQRIGITFRA